LKRRKADQPEDYFRHVVKVGDTTYLLPDRPRLYTCEHCGTSAWVTLPDYRTFSCGCACSCENHWGKENGLSVDR
jgi:hypothetical protein